MLTCFGQVDPWIPADFLRRGSVGCLFVDNFIYLLRTSAVLVNDCLGPRAGAWKLN